MRYGWFLAVLCFVPAVFGQATTAPADGKALAKPWLERASKEAAGIEDANKKLGVLGSIAQVWARAGEVEQFRAAIVAVEKVERAQGAKTLRTTDMYRFAGVLELIPGLVQAGRVAEARTLCQEVQGEARMNYEASVDQALATALAEAGKVAEARAIVGDQANKTDALMIHWAIARGVARTGKAAEVEEAIKPVPAPQRTVIYLTLIQRQMQAGDMAAVKTTIGKLPEEGRASAWSVVASRQMKQKDFAGARESLGNITEAQRRERLWLDLCFNQEQAGDLQGAQATALEMAGQSQELPAFNLVSRALVKKGDEAGAKAFREKISPQLRARADQGWRQILVLASADAGDGPRAAKHLAEMPDAERNFTFYLSVAVAQRQSQDEAGYRQNLALAQAEADAPAQKSYRASWYRQLAYRMAAGGDLDAAVKLAQQLTDERERGEALAGAVNGGVQSGDVARAWATIRLIPAGPERAGAAAAAAYHTLRRAQAARLAEWIEALPGAHERAQAHLAAGEFYVPRRAAE